MPTATVHWYDHYPLVATYPPAIALLRSVVAHCGLLHICPVVGPRLPNRIATRCIATAADVGRKERMTAVTYPSLINGSPSQDTTPIEIRSPFDDQAIGLLDQSGPDAATAAVEAAEQAQRHWGATTARARADLLLTAAQRIRDSADQLGELLARETGKRLPEAVGEIGLSAEYFRWFAEEARRPQGHLMPAENSSRRHLTRTRPAGVVASLTPWNFPCSIQARKLAPALAAGCTVVARVSEKAPLAVTRMIEIIHDAGLPDGVLNLVHGPAGPVTDAFLTHPSMRVVSFTGSTSVGRTLMSLATTNIVRPLLELGGNAPFIVFDDADVHDAVNGAMLAKFRNAGQSCIGANRFYVHDAVFDEFVDQFVAKTNALRVGPGLPPDVHDLGPLIDASRAHDVQSMVTEALGAGATLLTREATAPGDTYCTPALLSDVPPDVRISTNEIFGPVAGIYRFTDEDEVLAQANSTEMGLASYFYTRSFDRALRVSEGLDSGIIGINNALPTVVFAEMGGTKQSGIGREGGRLGLDEFLETSYLSIEL